MEIVINRPTVCYSYNDEIKLLEIILKCLFLCFKHFLYFFSFLEYQLRYCS